MTPQEIFSELVSNRNGYKVSCDSTAAQSLRISLTKQWKKYRTDMNSLGFLDPTISEFVISMEWDKENQAASFFLRPKKRVSVNYTVLEVIPNG